MTVVQVQAHWNYDDQAWETGSSGTGEQFQNGQDGWYDTGQTYSWGEHVFQKTELTGYNTSTYNYTTSNTVNSLLTYARTRTINFSATNLAANADNLVVTVDGIQMTPTPATGYSAGTNPNTVKTDNYGTVKGSFVIPANTIRTGIREVVISNDHNKAIATYSAKGIKRDITTTSHTGTINTPVYTTVQVEPLAESFQVPTDAIITSIDLYFATKPDGTDTTHRSNITLQIRGIGDQGFPNSTVYSEVSLPPDAVSTSTDGTVKTNFPLVDPMFVKRDDSYAIVLITDSDQYNVYVAKMGEHKLTGYKDILASQAYTNGVLFSSSNAQSWNISQETDLTFGVNCGSFNDTGTVMFDPIVFGQEGFTNEDGTPVLDSNGNPVMLTADQIVLLCSYLTPDNTGLSWQIRYLPTGSPSTATISSMPWQPLTNAVSQDLSQSVSQLQLQATFASSSTMSPMLALDDLTLGAILTASEGKYITLNQNYVDNPYNAIVTSYDAYVPDGTSVTPYYSLDGGTTWNPYTGAEVTKKQVTRSYYHYTYRLLLHNQQTGDMAMEDNYKGLLDIKSATPVLRPQVKNFTNVVSSTDNSQNTPFVTTTVKQ